MRYSFCVLAMVIALFVQQNDKTSSIRGCLGCLEEEREALLLLKASLLVNYTRPCAVLPSWINANKGSNINCCLWDRVKCSNATTGRVTELHLNATINVDTTFNLMIPPMRLYLNASLFLPFQELRILDFSSNLLYGTLEDEGFERLGASKNLEVLNLLWNELDNGVLPSIFTLTSLKELYLDGNGRAEGLTHFEGLNNLSKLECFGLASKQLTRNTRIMDYLAELTMLKILLVDSYELNGSMSIRGIKKLTRLEELDLSTTSLDWEIWEVSGALPNLKTLHLNFNVFTGTTTVLSGNGTKKFIKLQELYLRGNNLDWTIVDYLGALPNLKTLDLNYNNLNRATCPQGLKMLSNLESLYLDGNDLDTSVLDCLNMLPKLKTLSLARNHIDDLAPLKGQSMLGKTLESLDLTINDIVDVGALDSLGKLQQLKQLDLTLNKLNRPLLNQSGGLCSLKNLEVLDLSSCDLGGTLPPCLGNLTSLRVLDLSNNLLVGNIAASPIVALMSLETLILSNNQFDSLIPFSSLANHSKLIDFELFNDGASHDLVVETESPRNWVPTFQLHSFHLKNCKFDLPKGVVLPSFLYHQMELRDLTLAKANLQTSFPSWLLKNNTRLLTLDLIENNLTGTLQDLPPHSSLQALVASNNGIQGNIPINIGQLLPNLELLIMSSNSLKGDVPSSLGDMHQLVVLDLSSNSLSGGITEKLAEGCSLTYLNLSSNKLYGKIFPTFSGASAVRLLSLQGNRFTGEIPATLPNKQRLQLLDIRDNSVTGALPNWIGDMGNLEVLLLSKNRLGGSIPKSFCRLQSLEVLDLSNNDITGPIPNCFSPPSLKYVNLRGNRLTGSLDRGYAAFTNSSKLMALDVGDNHITGSIASWIADRLLQLRILVLKGNRLQGNIPFQLCHLANIRMMDLSFNNLFGPIPSCLANLTFNITSDSSEVNGPWENSKRYVLVPNLFVKNYYRNPDVMYMTRNYIYEHVNFLSKSRDNKYEGKNLRFASGVDLSSNKLSGSIPPEIGNLSLIHTLNLSHNYLTGAIPSTFSNLKSIESLDLSWNHLSGPIPTQLVELNFLAKFSVAHNNLSGETPKRIGQFGTFEENSYEGNQFLCGLPLKKNCSTTKQPSSTIASDDSSTNLVAFYASFAAAFVVGFIGVIVFLFINPYWRRRWFGIVDRLISSAEYYFIDRFYKLKHFVCAR